MGQPQGSDCDARGALKQRAPSVSLNAHGQSTPDRPTDTHAEPPGLRPYPQYSAVTSAESVPACGDGPRESGLSRSVLIVEDDTDIRETLSEVLYVAGYAVEAVASGPEAVVRLEKATYDAIVSDVRMPAMTGIDLYRWLQQNHGKLVTRFVLITGGSLDVIEEAFIAEQFIPVLAKPFSPSDVRRVVALACGGPVATAEPRP